MQPEASIKGRRSYIWPNNFAKIKAFCGSKKMATNEAVNHILEQHFFERELNVKEDINSLKRKIEYLTLILQPCLLELIERSGELKALSEKEPNARHLGMQSREQFEAFFLEMIQRVKEKHHEQ